MADNTPDLINHAEYNLDAPPNGDGLVNIVGDYRWTLNNIDVKEVPAIKLREYHLTEGLLASKMVYYANLIADKAQDGAKVLNALSETGFTGFENGQLLNSTAKDEIAGFFNKPATFEQKYGNRVFGKRTGWSYRFPYLTPEIFNRTNSYESGLGIRELINEFTNNLTQGGLAAKDGGLGTLTKLTAATRMFDVIGELAVPGKVMFQNGNGLDHTLMWSTTESESVSVEFFLFNTHETSDIIKNRNFIKTFVKHNTPSRRNQLVMNPPVFYDLQIKDVTYFPACYVTSVNVVDIGRIQMLNVGGKNCRIPEAYKVSVTFKSSFIPSRDLVDRAFETDSSDTIVTNTKAILEALKENGAKAAAQQQLIDKGLAAVLGPR
jgi:hypothetical protein